MKNKRTNITNIKTAVNIIRNTSGILDLSMHFICKNKLSLLTVIVLDFN